MTAGSSTARDAHRLTDFPFVFMSYDEPWAEDAFAKLQDVIPDARRVHGVKGLNACHVAAADAAGSEWFVSVDADTQVHPSIKEVEFSADFLQPVFRLDWQSRNAVNGIVSGNGCLKLWPSDLAREMRSHEAAPEDDVSLDADIGKIRPGETRLVLMPGCHSTCDPAQTPFHAFRAGFRESVFLAWHLDDILRHHSLESRPAWILAQVISTWCNLGTHTPHGSWVIYGGRLGLWARVHWQDWDPRETFDYEWFRHLWDTFVRTRIGNGDRRCALTDFSWNQSRLEAECAALGRELVAHYPSIALADFGPDESRLIAQSDIFPATRASESLNALGDAFRYGKGIERNTEMALSFYDSAALLMYPPALNDIARLHDLQLIPQADPVTAKRYYSQATSLGDPHAPYHLAQMIIAERGSQDAEAIALTALARDRGFSPKRGAT